MRKLRHREISYVTQNSFFFFLLPDWWLAGLLFGGLLPRRLRELLTRSRALELDVGLDLLEEFLHSGGGPGGWGPRGGGGRGGAGPSTGGAGRSQQPEKKYAAAGSPAFARAVHVTIGAACLSRSLRLAGPK